MLVVYYAMPFYFIMLRAKVYIKVLFFYITVFLFPRSAAGGEIFNRCVAEREEAFIEKDVQRLMRQILKGVSFLHRHNVVHLDLKVRTTQ